MNRRHMIPVLMSLILPGVTGCGESDTKDPSINIKQQETFLVALAKSPAAAEFVTMRVVASKNESDFWLITVIKDGEPKKRGKFKIDKSTQKVERLPG